MENYVIDSKTDVKKFGSLIEVRIATTLTLVGTESNGAGIFYDVAYTGFKTGKASGGPLELRGDGAFRVNEDPQVVVTVSDYADNSSHISLHILIQVGLPVFGNQTIFSQTLSGPYDRSHNVQAYMKE
jgi:hypothetical protein